MLDHVTLKCNPAKDAATAQVFKHRTARTLYLLWWPGHLVGPEFVALALGIGKLIDERDPQTAGELAMCFPVHGGHDFSANDVDRFCSEALPYFTGEKTVTYEIKETHSNKGD